jgi:ABC-2 type transport system permease protein
VSRRPRPLVTRLRVVAQTVGLLRKEVADIVRQPRVLLVLVIGPFLVLLLFAVGYDQQQAVLRTTFVGPPGSVYEESMDRFAEELEYYITNEGYGPDLAAAERRLANGEIDLVVVFPDDPAGRVLAGEHAVIRVMHDKIDPIQQTAVEIASQVAVQELNANVLEAVLTRAQDELVPLAESVIRSDADLARLEAAIADRDHTEVRAAAADLGTTSSGMAAIASATVEVAKLLGVEQTDEQRHELDVVRVAIDELDAAAARIADAGADADPADLAAVESALATIREGADRTLTIEPAVAIRPFASETSNVIRDVVGVNEYFAPAAIALLLQHMVLTFAAMGLVADRSLGLFEVFRVGPIGAAPILVGKYLAYLLIGGAVATALVASVTYGLDVPQRGQVGWLAVGIAGLLLAGIGAGMVLSLVARTEVQAVQYAMLALLSGLFFGGFFLDLDAFRYPVKLVSWALPVTYGVRLLRDVMLRGDAPATVDLAGLAATTLAFGLLAWYLLARRLRVR